MATTTRTTPQPAVDEGDGQDGSEVITNPAVPTGLRLRRRLRKVLSAALLVLLLLAAGYGGGHLHAWYNLRWRRQALDEQLELERNQAASTESALRSQLARAAERIDQAQAQRAALDELLTLYEGYKQVERALDALDARNFGIAESRVRQAERVLSAGTAGDGVDEVIASLAALHVSVASDLAPQRASVRKLSERLSTLIETRRAGLGAAAGIERAASP